jgi:hypothetical protein
MNFWLFVGLVVWLGGAAVLAVFVAVVSFFLAPFFNLAASLVGVKNELITPAMVVRDVFSSLLWPITMTRGVVRKALHLYARAKAAYHEPL